MTKEHRTQIHRNVTLKRVAIEDFDDFVFSSVAGGNNPDTKEHLEALSNS